MRIPTLSGCLLVPWICCGGMAAQVWPQGYATTNGGSSKATPFTISSGITPARTCAVIAFAGSSMPFASGHPIAGVAFRRDAIYSSAYAGYNSTVQIRIRAIASAATLTGAAHRVFGQEHEVFVGNVAIPGASPPAGPGAAPFALRIPFATTWTYPGGDFAIELTVTGPPGSLWRCDAVDLPWNEGGRSFSIGGGCPTSDGDLPTMRVRDLSTVHPGGSVEYVVDRLVAPPNGIAVFFELGPSASGIPLGAWLSPSCRLYVDPVLASVAGLFGNRLVNHARGGLVMSLPNSASLTGVRLAAQGAFFDFGLTAQLPIGVTQAIEIQLGATPPPASAFVGRTQWIHGSDLPGNQQGLQLGRANHVPVIEFF